MTKKNIIIIVIAALVLIILAYQSMRINRLEKKNQFQAVELMSANDSVTTYRTKAGKLYFDFNAIEVEKNALKNSLVSTGFTIKELRAMNIKWREIVSSLKAELTMAGHDTIMLHDTTVVTVGGNTFLGKSYKWTNNFLSLSGLISEKTMDVDYSYKVGMSFITEQQGKKIKITASLLDPHAGITTGSEIIIAHKTRWYEKPWLWGLAGIGAGIYIMK
jgi:hypothetical protein